MNTKPLPLILSIVTLVATGLLVTVHNLTAPAIEQQRQQAITQAVEKVIGKILPNQQLLSQQIFAPQQLNHRQLQTLYLLQQNHKITALAIPVTAKNGYSGDIQLMVGIKANGNITAAEVIAHRETPGLGDLIESNKSNWLKQFQNQSPATQNPWKIKKDGGTFDQITAATITSRTVTEAINKAAQYGTTQLEALNQ